MLDYDELIKSLDKQIKANDNKRIVKLKKMVDYITSGFDNLPFCIHIVGTNGKGSTGCFISNILQAAGYNVGMFNSPAIFDEREQIIINQYMISKRQFINIYQKLLPIVQRLFGDNIFTIFEWEFLISLEYFLDKRVDFIILEAGLGGKYDATNAIYPPQLSIFTKISLDHLNILGNSIEEITTNKVGILKSNTTVIVAKQYYDNVYRIISDHSRQLQVKYYLTEQFSFNLSHPNLPNYQLENIKTSLLAVKLLKRFGYNIIDRNVSLGIRKFSLFGRMNEINFQGKKLILDASHNIDGIKKLIFNLNKDKKYTLVLGFLKDKQVDEMINELSFIADKFILFTPDNNLRAMNSDDLSTKIKHSITYNGQKIINDLSVKDFWLRLFNDELGKNILITGSFYLLRKMLINGKINYYCDK